MKEYMIPEEASEVWCHLTIGAPAGMKYCRNVKCMAWRWVYEPVVEDVAGAVKILNTAVRVEEPTKGYCGLVGAS